MQLGGPNHFSVTVASRGVVIRSYRLRKNSVGRPLSEEELKTYTLYSECMRPHERGTYIGIEQVILFDGDAKEALDQYQTIVNQVRIIDSTNLQDKPADIGERLCLQDSYVSFYVDQNIFCF